MRITYLNLLASCLCVSLTSGDVIQLNSGNLRETLDRYELVLVNFYADWCRFSQLLAPIYADTERYVTANIDPTQSRIALAKVDCENQKDLAREYGVNKYPTIKLFRYGEVTKKEYRGQRSVESIAEYIQDQLREVVQVHANAAAYQPSQAEGLAGARSIVAYIHSETDAFNTFRRVASKLRTTPCAFHAILRQDGVTDTRRIGDTSIDVHFGDEDWVGALNFETNTIDRYVGDLTNFDLLATFTLNKCEPLVRELTFENAEELTEEGLPFLLLFYHPEQETTELRRRYRAAIEKEIIHERYNLNFLTADGIKFEHPLLHMGRSAADLPVIAIDSFKHIFLFPHSVLDFLANPNGQLKQFIDDHNSGKLHQELHARENQALLGGSQNQFTVNINGQQVVVLQAGSDHQKHDHAPQAVEQLAADAHQPKDAAVHKQAFESVFKKLGPSKQRYTFKEEL